MNIECNNIRDFCELINISVGQEIENKTVFASYLRSYPSVSFGDTPKNYKSFSFVCFTPLYTATYQGNVKADIFDEEYNFLKNVCSTHNIYIHTFDKLSYDIKDDTLYLENHIDVI